MRKPYSETEKQTEAEHQTETGRRQPYSRGVESEKQTEADARQAETEKTATICQTAPKIDP